MNGLMDDLIVWEFEVMYARHLIFGLHLLRIAKFALGVRQFIAAFNDGIYSVPSKCREINFTKQGGNELPHSKERCHARKSKIHSNILELKSSVSCNPFEVGSFRRGGFSVRGSACLYLIIRNSNVRLFDCSKVAASVRLIPPFPSRPRPLFEIRTPG
jgi:hypothetical protein